MAMLRRRSRGFTLIELILVLVLIGVLSFAAMRSFNRATFDTRGYADEVSAMLRFAQKEAIAKRRNVCVNVDAAAVTLSFALAAGGACDPMAANNAALPSPSGDPSFTRPAPHGVVLGGGGVFSFDPQGRPSAAQAITVTGDGVLVVTAEAETGYVH